MIATKVSKEVDAAKIGGQEDASFEAMMPSEMSIWDALAFGTRLHQLGERVAALQVYSRILEAVPDQCDVLQFCGMAHHQDGRSAEGLAYVERSISINPSNPGTHLNRGNILLELNRLDEAADSYARAAELGWDTAELHNNLGALHRAKKRLDEAERSYLRAIELKPDYADAHSNLGNLYDRLGRIEDAVRHCCLALVSQPQHAGARKMLAIAYHTLGRLDDAAQVYRDWLVEEPDNPLPRHYLAACTGNGVPARASDDYVEAVFDSFANSFDAKLASLTYRAPEIVGGAVAARCGTPHRALEVLDAGCGTGLCGSFLAPFAARLIGVDLSAHMLAKAKARAMYDALVKAELTVYLQQHPAAFDVIVSADTLCYFGSLDLVASAAAHALKRAGLFVFTAESSDAGAPTETQLHPHGRYSHRRDHVEHALATAGFSSPALDEVHLRNENGKPVKGWLVSARRAIEPESASRSTHG